MNKISLAERLLEFLTRQPQGKAFRSVELCKLMHVIDVRVMQAAIRELDAAGVLTICDVELADGPTKEIRLVASYKGTGAFRPQHSDFNNRQLTVAAATRRVTNTELPSLAPKPLDQHPPTQPKVDLRGEHVMQQETFTHAKLPVSAVNERMLKDLEVTGRPATHAMLKALVAARGCVMGLNAPYNLANSGFLVRLPEMMRCEVTDSQRVCWVTPTMFKAGVRAHTQPAAAAPEPAAEIPSAEASEPGSQDSQEMLGLGTGVSDIGPITNGDDSDVSAADLLAASRDQERVHSDTIINVKPVKVSAEMMAEVAEIIKTPQVLRSLLEGGTRKIVGDLEFIPAPLTPSTSREKLEFSVNHEGIVLVCDNDQVIELTPDYAIRLHEFLGKLRTAGLLHEVQQ